jgi:4-amino-4-deoxy-L-arabinose transferase-like glycosyltransferase
MIRSLFSRTSFRVRSARERAILAVALLFVWSAAVLVNYYTQFANFSPVRGWLFTGFYGERSLPYLSEATARFVTGSAAALLLQAASILLGLGLLRLVRAHFDSLVEALPFAAALGVGVFAYLGLVLAAFGLYLPGALKILAVLLPIGVGILALWWKRPAARFNIQSSNIKAMRKTDIVWLAITLLAAGMAFIAALAPEREYDALWYHLNYPRLYLEQGRLVDLTHDYVSLYPMTWELWFGYGLVFGGQTAATLLHFACLMLTALVVFLTVRRFAPSASPWFAAALFVTVPTVMWEASTAYIDLALALHTSLALYALLRFMEKSELQWLLLAALNLGLAVASKHLGLALAGLAVLILAGGLKKQGCGWKEALLPAVFLGGLALLPALPWYLRAYAASGNPFFPELFWLFGAPPERWDAQTQAGLQAFLDGFGRPLSLGSLLTLPWHMTVYAAAYHGSLGPLFLILLPGLLLIRRAGPLTWLALFALGFLLFWASPFSSLQMRFVVPLTPVLAVLAASAFARLQAAIRLAMGRKSQVAAAGLVGVLLFLNLPPFTALHERDRTGWDGWINSVLHGVEWGVVVGGESRQAYLSRQVRSFAAWEFANQNLPVQARLLTWAGGDQFYAERDWLWVNSTTARPAAWLDAQAQVDYLPWLQRLGITHLLVDREMQQRLESLLPGGDQQVFTLLYKDRWYAIYQVGEGAKSALMDGGMD